VPHRVSPDTGREFTFPADTRYFAPAVIQPGVTRESVPFADAMLNALNSAGLQIVKKKAMVSRAPKGELPRAAVIGAAIMVGNIAELRRNAACSFDLGVRRA
jgi:hypothetical protein